MPFRIIARQAYKTFPILNKVSQGTQVFVGTTLALAFCAVTFYGGEKQKPGHGAFDVDKPEAVQNSMEAAEKTRLTNFDPSTLAQKENRK